MMRSILYSLVAICLVLTITACGDSGSSSTTQINSQISVALVADKTQVTADGVDGVTLTVTVKDVTGSPIANQEVTFDDPSMLSLFEYTPTSPLITDNNGQVVLFIKSLWQPQNDRILGIPLTDISVSCLGGTSKAVRVYLLPAPRQSTASVMLVSDKAQAVSDGSEAITFTATVKDINGNPIAGQLISFKYEPSQRYTDSNGNAVFVMTHPPLLQRAPATYLNITATSGGVTSNSVDVTYLAPPAAQVTLAADKSQAIADGVEKITFTAKVKDNNGSPIPYQSIIFNVSPGANRSIAPISTDINGMAVMQLTVPPSSQRQTDITVTATSGTITSNSVVVSYTAPPQVTPDLVTLTSNKTTLIADGSDQVTFTMTATDSSGKPLAGQVTHLNIPYGPYMAFIQGTTNTSGKATAVLMRYTNNLWPASALPASISISATVNGANSNAIIITVLPP